MNKFYFANWIIAIIQQFIINSIFKGLNTSQTSFNKQNTVVIIQVGINHCTVLWRYSIC
jgi:hypothetical protein